MLTSQLRLLPLLLQQVLVLLEISSDYLLQKSPLEASAFPIVEIDSDIVFGMDFEQKLLV